MNRRRKYALPAGGGCRHEDLKKAAVVNHLAEPLEVNKKQSKSSRKKGECANRLLVVSKTVRNPTRVFDSGIKPEAYRSIEKPIFCKT